METDKTILEAFEQEQLLCKLDLISSEAHFEGVKWPQIKKRKQTDPDVEILLRSPPDFLNDCQALSYRN